jgi:hypothetical protein
MQPGRFRQKSSSAPKPGKFPKPGRVKWVDINQTP